MTDTAVVEKPVFRTGESVGKILAANDVAVNTPPPVTPEIPVVPTAVTPTEPSETPAATPAAETPIETPAIETPTIEKNTSVISFEAYETPETPAVETPSTPSSNWKEEIKKADLKEVLKELGIDEFAIELSDHRKNGGDPADYLQARLFDYTKISDEDILKADIRKQYVSAGQQITQKQVDILFERKYTLPEDATEDDKELLDLQLKTDANNSRQLKITEQQKFKIAAPIIQPIVSDQSQIQAEKQLQQQEFLKNWYSEHEATKALMTSKRVTLNLGENGSFNFDVSKPEFVTKALYSNEVWSKLTATKTGEPDVSKLQKLILYAADPLKFETDLVNYGKSLQLPALLEEGQNIVPPHKIIPMSPENKGKPEGYKTGKVG